MPERRPRPPDHGAFQGHHRRRRFPARRRSTALDTELDLAVEAGDEERRHIIAGLRAKLLAEHLDCTPETVQDAIAAEGSILRGIAKLGCNRCLRPVPDLGDLPSRSVFGTFLLDPERPFFLFPRKPRAKG
jgi:hypothetical protein